MAVYRNPLVRSLHVWGSVAIVVLSLLVGWLLVRHAARLSAAETDRDVTGAATRLAGAFDLALGTRLRVLQEIARDPDLIAATRDRASGAAGAVLAGRLGEEFTALAVADRMGFLVRLVGTADQAVPREANWWRQALTAGAHFEVRPDTMVSGQGYGLVAVPLQRQTGELAAGVLVGIAPMVSVMPAASSVGESEMATVEIVTSDGQILWRRQGQLGVREHVTGDTLRPAGTQVVVGWAETPAGVERLAVAPLRRSSLHVRARVVPGGAGLDGTALFELALFALTALLILYGTTQWLERNVLVPLQAAQEITVRVSAGDLRVHRSEVDQVGGGALHGGARPDDRLADPSGGRHSPRLGGLRGAGRADLGIHRTDDRVHGGGGRDHRRSDRARRTAGPSGARGGGRCRAHSGYRPGTGGRGAAGRGTECGVGAPGPGSQRAAGGQFSATGRPA